MTKLVMLLMSLLLSLPVLADTCPQSLAGNLPTGWHCSGSNCQDGTFVQVSFAGHKKFGTVTCFYENQGQSFSAYAWVSGGTLGDNWFPNTAGERCHKSIVDCEFGEVQTQ